MASLAPTRGSWESWQGGNKGEGIHTSSVANFHGIGKFLPLRTNHVICNCQREGKSVIVKGDEACANSFLCKVNSQSLL